MKFILPFVSAVQCIALQSALLDERKSFMDQMFGDLIEKGVQPMGLIPPTEFHTTSHSVQIKYPDDDDVSDLKDDLDMFGGIVTFGHFPTMDCMVSDPIDIAIVGAPFDTGVSFRPGARFGPNGIRQAARRLGQGLTPVRGRKGSKLRKTNPYNSSLTIVDCGDVPMIPFDNRVALNQLYRAQRRIHGKEVVRSQYRNPRIITLGGDHTVTLMNLRSAYEAFGEMAVIHFDSHIDTWDPQVLGGGITKYASVNHGTFLHYAAEAGYLNKERSTHVGIRAPYIVEEDITHDKECGFKLISARDLDDMGTRGISDYIKELVGEVPVYITIDIDVLDPAYAPGTGTSEVGGWSTRELLTVLDGLEGVNLVGADIVEVSPPYDTNAEITSLAASQIADSLLGLMVVIEKSLI